MTILKTLKPIIKKIVKIQKKLYNNNLSFAERQNLTIKINILRKQAQ